MGVRTALPVRPRYVKGVSLGYYDFSRLRTGSDDGSVIETLDASGAWPEDSLSSPLQ